jgi:thiol-disulfide isomerase/thioredoxin
MLIATTGSLWAQDNVWQRSCRFSTEVDSGGVMPGMVYEKKGTPDMLGQLPGDEWFLLQPSKRRVLNLGAGQVKISADAPTAILSGSLPDAGSPVKLTPAALTFDVQGRFVKVLPTPPLVGEVKAEDFLKLCPDFQEDETNYEPDSKTVTRLASAGKEHTVEVFFGSWCPHCQKILPKLIKSLRMAGNSNLEVKWIGLPRSFRNEPMVKDREVRGLPTIIVLEGEREVGRFTGDEKIPVEASLANLVGPG